MKRLLLAFLGFSLCIGASAQNEAGNSEQILLLNHTLRLKANDYSAMKFTPSEVVNGKIYRLVQDKSLTLNSSYPGFTTLEYIPKNTYLVSINVAEITKATDFLEGHGAGVTALLPEYKLSKNLANNNTPEWAWLSANTAKVWLRYYPDLNHNEVLITLINNGFDVIDADESNGIIAVNMNPENALEVASLPFIMQLQEMEDPGKIENFRARTSHRVNYLQADFAGAPGYDGTGITVGHGDDGAIDFHVDFTGRLTMNSNPSSGDHGDHVAGTIFGAGNIDPDGRGMAPGADLLYQRYPDNLNDADFNYNNLNVLITSSSYSNGCNAGYTNFTRQMDQDAIDNPSMIHVFSAGNSGTSDCGYGAGNTWGNITGGHKIAKNVIATANLTATDGIAGSSSRGPASDGRIKPDLGAVGTSVYSTTDLPSPNSYANKTGTSMACPGVSGTMATLYQAYQKTYSSNPHAGLMKAIAMNTCEDLGVAGPDFIYGYGRLNARRAAEVIENGNFLTDSISSTSGSKTFQIPMPTSGTVKEVKIMLYWPDVPASTIAARALVNDLDLLVTHNATNYQPWVMDPRPNAATLNAAATRQRDSLNNVEQVTIENPASGNFTVDVSAYNIPSGTQKFFITYSFVMDEIVVTHPAGGEGFDPTSFEYIRWDAPEGTAPFKIEYSTDGGTSWNTILNTANASLRHLLWTTIPSTPTDQAKIRITRGSVSGETPGTFTILRQATNLQVASSCPDSLKLTWNSVPGATGYIVYRLGAKYMDSITTSTTNSAIIRKNNPSLSTWYSVAAMYNNGVAKRAVAIEKPLGTFNCALTEDLKLNAMVSPSPALGAFTDCFNNSNLPVTVEVLNNGIDTAFGFDLKYQFNSGTIVSSTITDTILPGLTYQHTFNSTISLNPGNNSLDVWVEYATDQNGYNDTLNNNYNVITGVSKTLPFFDDFETFSNCGTTNDCGVTVCALPNGWVNVTNGQYDDIDWRTDNNGTTSNNTGPGADHKPGTSRGKYLYLEASGGCDSSVATLLSPCVVLDSSSTQNAVAEYWYHMYGNAMGTLSTDLIIGDSIVKNIIPKVSGGQGNLWKKASINLAPYMGQTVVIRINGKTGDNFESDIAIDDFSVYDPTVVAPTANYSISDSSGCTTTQFTFSDMSSTNASKFTWDFGNGATPATATGAGPHTVTYSTAGVKLTSLEVSNAGGINKKQFNVTVGEAPISNYNHSVILNTAYFIDQTVNAPNSWTWDFGDGNTSNLSSPQNTYSLAGKYEVTLTTTNSCGTSVYKDSIEITTGVSISEALLSAISLYPNPNDGQFKVELPNQLKGDFSLSVSEISGKVIRKITASTANQESLKFDISDLPDGVYLVTIKTSEGSKNIRVVKKR